MKMKKYFMGFLLPLMVGMMLTSAPRAASGQDPMSVSPDMFVLNAVGNFETIQCQFGGCPAGAIDGVSISMTLNGQFVALAATVHYGTACNTFVEFDRASLQANPYVQSLANTGTVTVHIYGSYLAGTTLIPVDRIGTMTIVAPKKKP
ncbi:MAG: hypothetical protein R6V49_05795 [Bacteroidales bacterium]